MFGKTMGSAGMTNQRPRFCAARRSTLNTRHSTPPEAQRPDERSSRVWRPLCANTYIASTYRNFMSIEWIEVNTFVLP